MSRRLLAGFALAVVFLAIGFWLKWRLISPFDPNTWQLQASGQFGFTDIVGIYIERNVGSHPFPYSQMRLEYPPVVGMIIYLTSFAPGIQGFFVANYLLLAMAGLGTLYWLHRLDQDARLWYLAAAPALLLYAGLNWDLIAVFFTIASLALFQQRRDTAAAVMLTLGVWSKLFPGLLLPGFLWLRFRQNNRTALVSIVGIFAAISIALNLPFFLLSADGWRGAFGFHAVRPPDTGALWQSLPDLPIFWINVVSASLTGLILLAASTWKMRHDRQTVSLGLAVLAFFILVDKVSSPQYHLWLLPFLALLSAPLWLVGAFVIMDLAYYTRCFGDLFLYWGGQSQLYALLSQYREPLNLLRFLILALLVVWALRRPVTSQDGTAPS